MGWHDNDDDDDDDDNDGDDDDDNGDDNVEENDFEDKAADLTGKGGRLSWGLRQPPVKVLITMKNSYIVFYCVGCLYL